MGAVVVAKGVAGVVFVEIEVAVEVGRVMVVFDELEDGEVAGGVGELVVEGRIGCDVFPEVEVGWAEAFVEVVESCDAVVKVAEFVEFDLIVLKSLGPLFEDGFELGLSGVVEPVVDAAFCDAEMFTDSTDGEFTVGFSE